MVQISWAPESHRWRLINIAATSNQTIFVGGVPTSFGLSQLVILWVRNDLIQFESNFAATTAAPAAAAANPPAAPAAAKPFFGQLCLEFWVHAQHRGGIGAYHPAAMGLNLSHTKFVLIKFCVQFSEKERFCLEIMNGT